MYLWWVDMYSRKYFIIIAYIIFKLFFPVETFADPISAQEQTVQMARGVNVLAFDPIWYSSSQAKFKPEYFKMIKSSGFSNVRIGLRAFNHMDKNGNLSKKFLQTLDKMTKVALDEGLIVIIDEHDFDKCRLDAIKCRFLVSRFWQQIAPLYKDASENLLFEILNEPSGQIDPIWNDMLLENLAIIRKTNPTRNVIIGPNTINKVDGLQNLILPENDRHIIVTIHYYTPHSFTFQGIPWSKDNQETGVSWGSQDDLKLLNTRLDIAANWAKEHNRPIFLGEFGSYEKAPIESRAIYAGAVARAAEARGFAWAVWQFGEDFMIYDFEKHEWIKPIYGSLIPK